MNKLIIAIVIVQAFLNSVGAFFLAKRIKKLKHAIESSAAISFALPFALYILPYSINPTTDKLIFFIEWIFYSFVINTVTGIPTAIITYFLKRLK